MSNRQNAQMTNLAFNVLVLVLAKTVLRVIRQQENVNVHRDGGVNIVNVYVLLELLVKNVGINAIVVQKETEEILRI